MTCLPLRVVSVSIVDFAFVSFVPNRLENWNSDNELIVVVFVVVGVEFGWNLVSGEGKLVSEGNWQENGEGGARC